MEIEVTNIQKIRFKSEADRDKYLDEVYPDRIADKFDPTSYWTDSSQKEKILAIWNVVEIKKNPAVIEV